MLDEVAAEQEPKIEREMRGKINYNIYVNTIKNTYKDIVKTGYQIDYNQVDKGEYIEITLKVPKNA
jgi:ParB family transcriptional regulator, chromosome partitioning protein